MFRRKETEKSSNQSYNHFMKTGEAKLNYRQQVNVNHPNLAKTHEFSSLSEHKKDQNWIGSATKSMGRRVLKEGINEMMPGAGTYLGKKATMIDVGFDFHSRHRSALVEGHTAEESFVCSGFGTASKTFAKRVGYTGLVGVVTAETFATAGIGILPGAAVFVAGVPVVEIGGELAGTVAQQSCHKLFDLGRKIFQPKSNSILVQNSNAMPLKRF